MARPRILFVPIYPQKIPIHTHKSHTYALLVVQFGINIHRDLWGFMDRPRILFVAINPHSDLWVLIQNPLWYQIKDNYRTICFAFANT